MKKSSQRTGGKTKFFCFAFFRVDNIPLILNQTLKFTFFVLSSINIERLVQNEDKVIDSFTNM